MDLYNQAKNISKTALAPISQAYYSSILVYKNKNGFLVHSGSNIDPLKKENLKIAKFRNCAEKQASLSALEIDRLDNNKLKILFLFRLDNKIKKLSSEKLLPCKDCFEKYIIDLQKNNGTLVLISEEMEADDFLQNGAKPRSQINFDNKIRFIFFQGEELTKLKLESNLGSNIQ